MNCCRCATALVPAEDVEGGSRCPRCGGVFVHDVKSYRTVESTARLALFELRRIPATDAQLQPLACPRCAATMTKGTSERDREVVVDVCAACGGCWLDGGELEAIQVDALPTFLRTVARRLDEA